jgi:hypothetical protein
MAIVGAGDDDDVHVAELMELVHQERKHSQIARSL